MARPICFHCGRQLMYVKLKHLDKKIPVFVIYKDPIGNEHKLHLQCATENKYKAGEKQYG